ncbi:coiled-coil domain-containing protein 169 [Sorex fumeus]|uniref:coiled-coil domain-containing protein 169 n=1 Tax=Sorex fumeus TaxID=62283 RepID=UPI0024AE27AC|nr:coiled-coil domain-containing protein 169 [Sorex fumeus]
MEDGRRDNYEGLSTAYLKHKLKDEVKRKNAVLLSIYELRQKISELENKIKNEKEGCQWRVRYEAQLEMNSHLEKQVLYLKEKVDKVRGNYTDRLASIRIYEQMPVESLIDVVRQISKEKRVLESQVKDYTLRREQESKLIHKANNECRKYAAELHWMSSHPAFRRQQVDYTKRMKDNPMNTVMRHSTTHEKKRGSDRKSSGSNYFPRLNL